MKRKLWVYLRNACNPTINPMVWGLFTSHFQAKDKILRFPCGLINLSFTRFGTINGTFVHKNCAIWIRPSSLSFFIFFCLKTWKNSNWWQLFMMHLNVKFTLYNQFEIVIFYLRKKYTFKLWIKIVYHTLGFASTSNFFLLSQDAPCK